MRTLIFFLSLLGGSTFCAYHTSTAQVIINEFQPNPVEDEPEWIELYNPTNQRMEGVNLRLHDSRSGIIIHQITILPYGFAVLTTDTALLKSSHLIPNSTPLYEVKIPTLNNSTDMIILRSEDSTMLDSVYYNVKWIKKGISFERKNASTPATYPVNLFASRSPDSSSCGYINSISPQPNDVGVTGIRYDWRTQRIRVDVVNSSDDAVLSPRVELSIIDSTQPPYLFTVTSGTADSLIAGDTMNLQVDVHAIYAVIHHYGSIRCIAVCHANGDHHTHNDTLQSMMYLSYPRNSVLVNEILYEPKSGGAEFIELYNPTDTAIDLRGWKLHDRPTSSGADTLQVRSSIIDAHQFVVLAWDSVLVEKYPELRASANTEIVHPGLSLNSDGDAIVLRDPNGEIIDSLEYSPHWHDKSLSSSKGISLEKIRPSFHSNESSSWSSCGNLERGATPGRQNSLAEIPPSSDTLRATPNPFSPGSVRSAYTLISFTLASQRSSVNATIYSLDGLPVRQLLNTTYTAHEGAIIWNGKDEAGFNVPPGGYVLVMEYTDSTTGKVSQAKLLLAVAAN